LNGNNYTVSNLYINAPSTSYVGLFGSINAATISNIGVTGTVIANTQSGGLVGVLNNGSLVTNAYSGVNIYGAGNTGGLVGAIFNVGTGSTIANSYSNGSVTSSSGGSLGGLVGAVDTNGVIRNSYSSANVTGYLPAIDGVGGLVGWFNGSTISNSYSTGSVYGSRDNVGGLIGYVINSGAIISNSYSTGSTTSLSPTTLGGFVGRNAGTITNSFWDTVTSGQSTGIGTGTLTGVTGGTFTGSTGANLSALATYSTNWTITSTPSTTTAAPSTTWFIFAGQTRPMLMMEYNTTITNAHQLQIAGSTLGANYTLANNISLSTQMANASDVWGTKRTTGTGSGFAPIGNSTNNFTGSFNGSNFAITNLYIDTTSASQTGLFGYSSGNITNLGVNANVYGGGNTGILVGNNAGTISNTYITGTVSGTNNVRWYDWHHEWWNIITFL